MSELNPLSQVPLSTSGPLWQRIFSYLDPPDLGRCERVCKSWRHLLTDHTDAHKVWQLAHNRRFAPLNCADPKQVKDRVITHWRRTHFRPLTEEAKPEYKVIYGDTDSRKNLHDLDGDSAFTSLSSQIKRVAKSVACIIHQNYLVLDPIADRYQLTNAVPTLGERLFDGKRIGEEERFIHEASPGSGTAFLVGKDLILTAAHCICRPNSNKIDSAKLRQSYFLFDFAKGCKDFGSASVFRCASVVARRFVHHNYPSSQDWALLRLRRPVSERDPLPIDFSWDAKVGQQVGMLGHPLGLPMKFTGMAEIHQVDGEQVLEIGTTLDAFSGNSGSPVFAFSDKGLSVVAMLVRGQKDFKVVHNYQGSGESRLIDNRVRGKKELQTGLRIERLHFLQGFLPALKAATVVGPHKFAPGLSVEGACNECHLDHLVIQLPPTDDATYYLGEVRCETQCAKGHRLPYNKVHTLALTACFYRIEARNSQDFRVSYEDLLGKGMLLRFDLREWQWIKIQSFPLLPPYSWPAQPGQPRCSVEETADGLCFALSCEGQECIRLERDQVEGWIGTDPRAWRHLDPQHNGWHPAIRCLTPHIAADYRSITFSMCTLPIEGGQAIGYLNREMQLCWRLYKDGQAIELARDQVTGLGKHFSEPVVPAILPVLSYELTQFYNVQLQKRPLRLRFKVKNKKSPQYPSIAKGNEVTDYVTAALYYLHGKHYGSCYGQLRTELIAWETSEQVAVDRIKAFFSALQLFQQALAEAESYGHIREWMCPSSEGLLTHLEELVNKLPLVDDILHTIEQGIDALASSQTDELIQLKIDYLMLGYHLARQHRRYEFQKRALLQLGDLYLQIAPRRGYTQGYREALICFGIAQTLLPGDSFVADGLSRVEKAFVCQNVGSFEGAIAWAKSYIWQGKSGAHLLTAAKLAEQLIEFGQLKHARAIYSECTQYILKHPPLSNSKIQARSLALASSNPSTQPYWQSNRQLLVTIRKAVASLLDQQSYSVSAFPAFFKPHLLDALRNAHLLTATASLDDLNHLAADRPSLPQLLTFHSGLMRAFTAQLFEQAVALFGTPPCAYALVGVGSLARGEMGIGSDLNAILLVEKDDPDIRQHFQNVAQYFELAMINLGETQCYFAKHRHLASGFSLTAPFLHPRHTIETPEHLYRLFREASYSMMASHSLDPNINALSSPCLIIGDQEVFNDYQARLGGFFADNSDNYGNTLLASWQPPYIKEGMLNLSEDVYLPITLLLGALAAKHGVDKMSTAEQLDELEKHLPEAFIALCRKAITLCHRLRLAPANDLSYADHTDLQEVTALLLKPLSKMALTQGIDKNILAEARAAYFEKLVSQEHTARARALYPEGLPLSESAAALTLYEGQFEPACHLFQQLHPVDDPFEATFDPYQKAWKSHSSVPATPDLDRLAGRLHLLKMRGYRRALPPPPKTVFEGDARCQALREYIAGLRLVESIQERAWEYAYEDKELPNDHASLYAALTGIERATLNDLLYADIIYLLREVLGVTQDKQVYSYLFHLFPQSLRQRFLQELSLAGCDPQIGNELAHFPTPDGQRPLYVSPYPSWDLGFLRGQSSATAEGIETGKMQLSKKAVRFIRGLIDKKLKPNERHAVGEFQGTFFKLNPEFPGREAAYLSLCRLITGDAYPSRQLLRVTIEKSIYVITASQAVPGPSLQQVLDQSPERLEHLDFRHYCFQVLMTLIALPEDAKPDNLIFHQPTADGPAQLVDIDPERIFFDAIKKRKVRADQIQCKSILLCLDQMNQSIDPDVCAEFCSLHPAALFQHWLADIELHNQRCSELFDESFINQGLQRDPTTVLPFFLEPTLREKRSGMVRSKGLLITLYKRFRTLQEALKSNSKIKLIDLLSLINKKMGAGYRAQLVQHKPAIKRFCELTKNQYQRKKGITLSITSTRLRGAYHTIEEYHQRGWTVASAKKDLNKILLAHTTQKAMIEDLVEGEGTVITMLNDPEVSNATLKGVDFSALAKDVQSHILNRIKGLRFNRLHLSSCQVLTDGILKEILQSCPKLTLLDLGDSSGITRLDYLTALCPGLSKINLRGINTLETICVTDWRGRTSPLTFSELRSLDISNCPQLHTLNLQAPTLQNLRCLGRALPSEFLLDCPSLVSLSVDTDANLSRLSRYKPQRLLFGDTAIAPVESFDPMKFRNLTSILRSEGSILYQFGSLDQSKMCARGKVLGYSTFVVDCRSPIKPARCFIRPFEGTADLTGLINVVKKNRRLTSLDLRGCDKLTDDGVAAVAEHCPQLTSLYLSGCGNITDVGARALAEHCPQLTSLDLSLCKRITDIGVQAVAEHCPQLTNLYLYGCKEITDVGVRAVAEHCPQLRSLNLSWCKVTDIGVEALAEHCPQLTSLNLSECKEITDVGLQAVAEHCPQLTSLNLSWCYQITDDGAQAVAEHCPQLTNLDLRGCKQITDDGVRAVAKHCPELTSLDLFRCHNITDGGVRAVAEHCPQLTSLNLRGCKRITDVGVQAVAARCPQLTNLDLSQCDKLTDVGVQAVAERCPQLTSLNLSGCKEITDGGVRAVAEHCPELTSLNLSECKEITDVGVQAVAEHCPQLTSLNLSWCYQITDDGAQAVAEHCPELTSLNLSECKEITDVGVQAVAKHCPQLTYLNLSWCRKITDGGVQALRARYPNLIIGRL